MKGTTKKIMDIYSELSDENRQVLMNYARVAQAAENSAKRPVSRPPDEKTKEDTDM